MTRCPRLYALPFLALLAALAAPRSLRAQTCTEVEVLSPEPSAAAARSAASCSGCSATGQATIRFRFASAVPCGRFVDGSPWIAAPAGGVPIVEIFPEVSTDCGGTTCNGWMLNVSGNGQAFDSRTGYSAAAEPPVRNPTASAPFVAHAGDALVKSVSFQDEVVGADCSAADKMPEPRHCLYWTAVLTVLDAPPPDGTGGGYFRPPFVGTARPLIPVAQARLDRLPRLPTDGFTLAPMARTEETLCQNELMFMGGYPNQYFKGYLNVGESRGYHGYVAASQGDRLLRVLFADRTERAAACVVQRGIDLYHMLLPPVSVSWSPNGGHAMGPMMWPYLAAALLERPDWAVAMTGMARGRFAERSQIYWSPLADSQGARGGPGEVLYGSHPAAGGLGQCQTSEYIGRCYPDWPGSCNRICADPFGFIDGGDPGTSYQQIFSPCLKAYTLTAALVPGLGAAWPRDDGHALALEYIDRWVDFGAWAAPDPCDAASPLDPSSPANCASQPLGTCVCRPGTGRYVAKHGTSKDGGSYGTAFTRAVWNRFRPCADGCACPGMEGLCAPQADAGSAGPDAAGPGRDAASPALDAAMPGPTDAASPLVDGGPVPADAAVAPADAGGVRDGSAGTDAGEGVASDSGCGCSAGAGPMVGLGWAVLLLALRGRKARRR